MARTYSQFDILYSYQSEYLYSGAKVFSSAATGSGVGTETIVSVRTVDRSALGSNFSSSGYSDSLSLWVNRGVTLSEDIKMPPFWVDAKPKFVRRIR